MDDCTVQCSAKPIVMANSTAWRLSTGNDPGRPRQTGQTFVLGSSPKALRQPQNSFVAVDSSQCTSRPTTVSHGDSDIARGLLDRSTDAEHQSLLHGGRQH